MVDAPEEFSEPAPHRPRLTRTARLFRVAGGILLFLGLARIGFREVLPHTIVQSPRAVSSCVPDQSIRAEAGCSKVRTLVESGGQQVLISSYRCRSTFDPDSVGASWKIILLHGHGDCKETQLPLARELVARGYEVVVPDLPAHNESAGEYVTYGVKEGRAIAALVDTLFPRNSAASSTDRILLWGFSLGGATAIHAAVLNGRVDAVVSISAFSSLREVIPDYLDNFFPVHPLLISEGDLEDAISTAGAIAGFRADRASTTEVASRLSVPLLIIHGDSDSRMPIDHAHRIRNAAGRRATLRTVSGAGHSNLYSHFGVDRLVAEVDEWLESSVE